MKHASRLWLDVQCESKVVSGTEFHEDYCAENGMRERLYPLFEFVFDISENILTDFHQRGLWDPTYHPYTLFDDGRAIANVSMFALPLVVGGKPITVAGIQSVMTHPDYRGQGLMKRLFEVMLHDIDSGFEASLLFTEKPNLYTKFGFQTVSESCFVLPYEHTGVCEERVRRLNAFDPSDMQLINTLLHLRTPASEHFFPLHYKSSFYLNIYDQHAHERLYYAKDLNAIIVFAVNNDTLELYDLIAPTFQTLEDVCAQIPASFSKITLHFCPDRFTNVNWTPVPHESTLQLMVRGNFDGQKCLKYPETAKF